MSKKPEPEVAAEFDFDTFECNTLEDFRIWNKHARKEFRAAKKMNPKCDPPYPMRIPKAEHHKIVTVKFQRFDQPENVLKAKLYSEEIDWEGQLKPGKNYNLPLPVVRFLNSLAVPIFAEVKTQDGGETITETKQVGERNRFSCQLLDLIA